MRPFLVVVGDLFETQRKSRRATIFSLLTCILLANSLCIILYAQRNLLLAPITLLKTAFEQQVDAIELQDLSLLRDEAAENTFLLSFGNKTARELCHRRSCRFPSLEQRLKLYMGDWYNDCPTNHFQLHKFVRQPDSNVADTPMRRLQGDSSSLVAVTNERRGERIEASNSVPGLGFPFVFNVSSRRMCSRAQRLPSIYCRDTLYNINHHARQLDPKPHEWETGALIVQYGDGSSSPRIPIVMKVRPRKPISETLLQQSSDACPLQLADRTGAIVWKINNMRHYFPVYFVWLLDSSWARKKDMAIWRGGDTGAPLIPDDEYEALSDEVSKCFVMHRCRFVYNVAGSSPLLDVKFSHKWGSGLPGDKLMNDGSRVPLVASKGWFMSESTWMDLMRYKGIIILEGNDVATGLKWALLSQSVVLMPRPRLTSWAMEELLEPWVHYIPIEEDGSDAESRVQWMLDNQEEAQAISRRATEWMQDLVFDDFTERDNGVLYREMLRRVQRHFVGALNDEREAL